MNSPQSPVSHARLCTNLSAIERALQERQPRTLSAERRAAVSIILWPSADRGLEVLFIERTRRPDDPWSGQMAFPGGRLEENDRDALGAARRETLEEVGLNLEGHGRLLGVCDDVQAMARGRRLNLTITPCVFELTTAPAEIPWALQTEEVAGILWASFDEMASGKLHSTCLIERPDGQSLQLPCYQPDGKTVWGLTYLMLSNLFGIISRPTTNDGAEP
jgi:8-oxo-dGTP pyrophosphatase MutT (NUDIX family)